MRSVRPLSIVHVIVILFFLLFSYLAVVRIHQLWASYFDLGIMHQTVFNTYKALQTGDMTRVLELTDPHGSGMQIKRMAIHNDLLLGLLAPLYFIHAGPETLLLVQVLIVTSGAYALYLIAKKKALSTVARGVFLVVVPLAFLMYPPLQRTLLYEFHAVVLATGFMLWMYYAWITRHRVWFVTFFILSMLTKEHVGFTIGGWLLVEALLRFYHGQKKPLGSSVFTDIIDRRVLLTVLLALVSFIYALCSTFAFIPSFRSGDEHFALSYFSKTSTGGSFIGQHISQFASYRTIDYLFRLFGPLGFLSFLSPLSLGAIPEIALNVLSSSSNQKNIFYHYTALITPWIFIGLIDTIHRVRNWKYVRWLPIVIILATLYLSYLDSPMPYSLKGTKIQWLPVAQELPDIRLWQQVLDRDEIKVSSVGQLAPYLTNRRYFYDFGPNYVKAEYILIRLKEVYDYPDKARLIPAYEQLQKDEKYSQIYKNGDVEVYRRKVEETTR